MKKALISVLLAASAAVASCAGTMPKLSLPILKTELHLQHALLPQTLAAELRALHTPEKIIKADLAVFARSKEKAIPPGTTGLTMSQAQQAFLGNAVSNYPVLLFGTNTLWQSQIQAVLTTAGTAGGGNVYLPGATIPLASSLTPYSNVHLMGSGPMLTFPTSAPAPDTWWTPGTGGTWFTGATTYPAISFNTISRTTGGFFIAADAGTTTGYLYDTSQLAGTNNILILTTAGAPSAMATISSVNSHQSVTFSGSVTASNKADWLLQQGTITSGSGTTWTLSTTANMYGYDQIYGGTSGVTATISSVNGNVVTFQSSAAFTPGEPMFLLCHPVVPSNSTWINQGLLNFSVENCGFYTFSEALQIGGRSSPGMFFGGFKNVYIGNCLSWGADLWNCQHILIDGMWCSKNSTQNTGTGQFRMRNDSIALSGGNSSITHLYCLTEAGYQTKGIVFEAWQNNSVLNDIPCFDIQNNQYSPTATLSPTACTMTSGTALISLASANTLLVVGQPVVLSAAQANSSTAYTVPWSGAYSGAPYNSVAYPSAGSIVFVTSVTSSGFTVALSRTGLDLLPNASGTAYVSTKGMPLLEATAYGNGSIQNVTFAGPDLESRSSATVYAENSNDITFFGGNITASGANSDVALCLRNSSGCFFRFGSLFAYDMDSLSNNNYIQGQTGSYLGSSSLQSNGILQYCGLGPFTDSYSGFVGVLDISAGKPANASGFYSWQTMSGGWQYPGFGSGLHVTNVGNGSVLANSEVGIILFQSSSASQTWTATLPSITGYSATNKPGSLLGATFVIYNNLYGTGSPNTLKLGTGSAGQAYGTYASSGGNIYATLSPGASMTIVAVSAASGVLGTSSYYWAVIGTTGTVTFSTSGMPVGWVLVGFGACLGWVRSRRQIAKNNFAFAE